MKRLCATTLLIAIPALVLFSCGSPRTPELPRPGSPWRPDMGQEVVPGGPNVSGLLPWTGAEGTWYQIFTVAFYDGGHRYVGDTTDVRGIRWDYQSTVWGDLRGIIQRLDHLSCLPENCYFRDDSHPEGRRNCYQSLHVDGLWLTPIMLGTSYHLYDTECFITVDPRLGTEEDVRELVRQAHARGIRVILDLVINHTSFMHPWFINALREWQSGQLGYYSQFFDIRTHPQRDPPNRYQAFGLNNSWHRPDVMDGLRDIFPDGVRTPEGHWVFYYGRFGPWMPDLNWESPAVKREFERILDFWLSPQTRGGVGLDGFRLDATLHIFCYPTLARGDWEGDDPRNLAMLTWFSDTARRFNPNVFLVGEAWITGGDSERRIIDYHRPGKSSFAFAFADHHGRIARAVRGGTGRNFSDGIVWYSNEIRALHPHAIFTPFLTNHDKERAAAPRFLPRHEYRKMAASLLLLSPGAPFIYYGEEIGLYGGARPWGESHSDRIVRGPMIFSLEGDGAWNVENQFGLSRPHPGSGRGVNPGEGGNWNSNDFAMRRHLPAYGGGGREQREQEEWSLLRHYMRLQNMKLRHPFIAWGRVDDSGIEADQRGQVAAFRVTDDKPYLLDWNGRATGVPNPTFGRSVIVAHNTFGAGGAHGFLRIRGMDGFTFDQALARVDSVSALYVPPSGERPYHHEHPVTFDTEESAFWLRPFATVIIREWE